VAEFTGIFRMQRSSDMIGTIAAALAKARAQPINPEALSCSKCLERRPCISCHNGQQ
jgi:hypothetical protein